MAERLVIKEIYLGHQFEAYTFKGDDGYPASKVFDPICVDTVDGRMFFLPRGRFVRDEDGFVGYAERYHDTDKAIERIREAGSIDPDCWVEVMPINLEDEWGPEAAYRERQDDAMGFGNPYF